MKITILAGGNRKDASSTKASLYIQSYLISKGHDVTLFDLYKQPIPFYSPDTEENIDNLNLTNLKKAMMEADAIVLSTPEYHGAPSGVLKNALDFLYEEFDGKVVLSVSSAGGAVGTSSLVQMQMIVRNLHGVNCPEWISLGGEQRAFTEQGESVNPKVKDRIQKATNYFLMMTEQLAKESLSVN